MNRISLLRGLDLGSRIAEDEVAQLSNYFVETTEWYRVHAGQIDIVSGPKGSGKSAIYAALQKDADRLWTERKIILISAENPKGDPVFQALATDPPASEEEFIRLWKLYFLCLIHNILSARSDTIDVSTVGARLETAGLVAPRSTLRSILATVIAFAKKFRRIESAETAIEFDPITGGVSAVVPKISFGEPTREERENGSVSVDDLFEDINDSLRIGGQSIWILVDRLDVAFIGNADLEENALRALFRVYRDLLKFDSLALKIFIRTDIWQRISHGGYREASHLTRKVEIEWPPQRLMDLIVRRFAANVTLLDHFKTSREEIGSSYEAKTELFYNVFQRKIEPGGKRPDTFNWLMTRAADGTDRAMPREVIHLLTESRDKQISRLERGEADSDSPNLIDGQALKDALPEVSRFRFDNTLLAEYPELRDELLMMEGQKTFHTRDTLCAIFGAAGDECRGLIAKLVEAGFLKPKNQYGIDGFWVPFIYRPRLKMTQGTAEGVDDGDELLD